MGKLTKNQRGFAAVETVLVLIIVALIAGIGVYVYHTKQNTDKTLATASSESSTVASTKTAANTNPYAGWKSYCSSYGDLCLKYPTNWTLKTSASDSDLSSHEVLIESPGQVYVRYDTQAEDQGNCSQDQTRTFHVLSINSPVATNDFKIIKTTVALPNIDPPAYAADYFLTSSTQTQISDVKVGTIVWCPGIDISGFVSDKLGKDKTQSLDVETFGDNDGYFSSAATAQAWLSSNDVKTGGQILASVSYDK